MRRIALSIFGLLASACGGAAPSEAPPATAAAPPATTPATQEAHSVLPYPATKKEPASETLFGVTVHDDYRWLEDVKRDDVRAWMSAEDQLARDEIAKLPDRERLAARLKQLYYVDAISAPQHRGGRFFYVRTHADKEKAIVYWREGERGAEHVLLDPNTMSKDGTTSLHGWWPSWDGNTVAYNLSRNNSDEASLQVLDVATGKISTVDAIDGTKYSGLSWTPKGDGFYYVRLPPPDQSPPSERPGLAEVRFHHLGSDPAKDPIVVPRSGNPQQFIGADLSRDGHWLFRVVQHGWSSSDVYFRDARKHPTDDKAPWIPLAVGIDAQFTVEAHRDVFYVQTNDGAPRSRLYRVDPAKVARADWKEIIPEQKDATLEWTAVVGEHLLAGYLKNASSTLELFTLDGKRVRSLDLPGIGALAGVAGRPEDDAVYYGFASFTQPPTIYKTSVKSGKTETWAEVKLPIDPSPFTVEQVWYPSKDGTRVSMFLVHRKDLPRDGSTPFLLTGYGGFNVSLQPSFSSGLYPWLEAGGGYAVPNLRGGGEYGEEWHKGGMGAKKQNVFDDFTSAAEYLVKEGYTRRERLAIRGGSNGGLLMGAAITQRPELFRAVICAVPLLDMVRYHKFGSGKTWVPEYGSADDEAGFRVLHAYSPYHHVAKRDYPALLMMSADSDDRVDPMHARKMVALLQEQNTSRHPILLRIEQHAGHGGADLVKQAVEQSADALAFLMHELGMSPPNGLSATGGP